MMLNLFRLGIIIPVLIIFTIYTTNYNVNGIEDYSLRHDRQLPEGSSIELTCDLIPLYTDQTKWRKYNGNLNPESKIINGKLKIPYLTLGDSGAYECFTLDGEVRRVHLIVKTQLDFDKLLESQKKMK